MGGCILKHKKYKDEEFEHFREMISEKTKRKEKIVIPFKEIESLNLNNNGVNIPFSRTNVVNVERYMLWYWCPIIGSDAIMLFIHLWEYCDQNEGVDICYPKLEELKDKLGISRPKLNRLTTILDENNFLIKFQRLNKLDNNSQTSPIFKLRSTVPMLSEEQIQKLSPKLKEKHDEYLEKFGNGDIKIDRFNHDFSLTLQKLEKNGDILVSKKARERIKRLIEQEKAISYLMGYIEPERVLDAEKIKIISVTRYMSKPVFEAFFKNAVFIQCHYPYDIDVVMDDIEYNRYQELGKHGKSLENLNKAINEYLGMEVNLKIHKIEQYIVKTLKAH